MREQSRARLLNFMGSQLDKIVFSSHQLINLRLLRNLTLSVGMLFVLAGCSSLPDAMNPVHWYQSAKNAILGDDQVEGVNTESGETNAKLADGAKVNSDSEKSFPSLGSVPERPVSSKDRDRKRIAKGLVSDREDTRQYSAEVIRRQGEIRPDSNLIANTQLPTTQSSSKNLLKKTQTVSSETTVSRALPNKLTPSALTQNQKKTLRKRKKPPYVKRLTKSIKGGEIVVASRNKPKLVDKKMLDFTNRSYGPETVVITGSGIVSLGAEELNSFADNNQGYSVAGARSLEEFNPQNVRQSYQVATILFDNGSARLSSYDRRILREVAEYQKKNGGTMRVVGHASSRTQNLDPIWHQMVNFMVSSARADAVLKQLVRFGARPANIFVGSVSDSMPRFKENMPFGEAGNRRAEIYLDF